MDDDDDVGAASLQGAVTFPLVRGTFDVAGRVCVGMPDDVMHDNDANQNRCKTGDTKSHWDFV